MNTKLRKKVNINNKKPFLGKAAIAISCLFVFLFVSSPAYAQVTLNLPAINNTVPKSPDTLVHWIYLWSLVFVGLAGFTAFLWGGIMYLTAVGDPSKAGEAKDRLSHALLGLLIVSFSSITLRFINPDFFKFNAAVLPQIGQTFIQPHGGPPGVTGYLSCQAQGEAGFFCAPVFSGACGADPQCVPCIGFSQGDSCAPAPQPRSDFTYVSCVQDFPCLAIAQGGSCPANFPCSDIAGGFQSSWQVVPDGTCLDPSRPVECVDGAEFDSAAHVCCATQ